MQLIDLSIHFKYTIGDGQLTKIRSKRGKFYHY